MSQEDFDELASMSDIVPQADKLQVQDTLTKTDDVPSESTVIIETLKSLQEQMDLIQKRAKRHRRKRVSSDGSSEFDVRQNVPTTTTSAESDETPSKKRKMKRKKGRVSVAFPTDNTAFDRERLGAYTSISPSCLHQSSANSMHHSRANSKHLSRVNSKHHRSANTLQLSSADLGDQMDDNPQGGVPITQQYIAVSPPVVTKPVSDLYDRLSLLPSDDNLTVNNDDDDDEGDDVHGGDDSIVHPAINTNTNTTTTTNNNNNTDGTNLLPDGVPSIYKGVALPFTIETPGAPVDDEWATLIAQTWDKKYVYTQMKPIWEKYSTPENLADKLFAPAMNEEILSLFEKWQAKNDQKHCGMQKSLIKCVTATLKLNDIIAGSSLDDVKKTESLQTCIDVTAMMSQVTREMSLKRRGFAKTHIHGDFKDLCAKSRPITKKLFGDTVAEDVKQIKVTKQLSRNTQRNSSNSNSNGRFQNYRNHFLPRGRGRFNNQNANNQYQGRAPPNYTFQPQPSHRGARRGNYKR